VSSSAAGHGRRTGFDKPGPGAMTSCAISSLSRTMQYCSGVDTRGHELQQQQQVRFLIATGVAEGSIFAAPSLAGQLARRHP
jgi:hypothetical protein